MAKRFNKYNNRFIKASLYIYSTPKYKAKVVSNKTKLEVIKANKSMQKTKWESSKSKQKNHLPKSTKVYVPVNIIKYSSFKDKNKTPKNTKIEP